MTYYHIIKQELTSNIVNEQPQFLQTFTRCEASLSALGLYSQSLSAPHSGKCDLRPQDVDYSSSVAQST
jgi:hypothetical protein